MFPIAFDTVAAQHKPAPSNPFPKRLEPQPPTGTVSPSLAHGMCPSLVYSLNLDVSSCDQILRDSEQNSPVKACFHPCTKACLSLLPISHLLVSFVPLAKVFITSFQMVITIRQRWASTAMETCPKSVVNKCGQRSLGLQVSLTSTEASSKR